MVICGGLLVACDYLLVFCARFYSFVVVAGRLCTFVFAACFSNYEESFLWLLLNF